MLFDLIKYLFLYVLSMVFIIPISIFEYEKYKFMISMSIIIGIYIYQRKRFINIIKGYYRWLRFKDKKDYINSKYIYLFLVIFVGSFISNKYSFIGLFISLIMIFFMELNDGKRSVKDLSYKDYIKLGLCKVMGLNSSNILFSKVSNLSFEDSFIIHSICLIAINMAMLLKVNCLYFNVGIFAVGVCMSYICIFFYRYLYSINRLKWIGVIGLIVLLSL